MPAHSGGNGPRRKFVAGDWLNGDEEGKPGVSWEEQTIPCTWSMAFIIRDVPPLLRSFEDLATAQGIAIRTLIKILLDTREGKFIVQKDENPISNVNAIMIHDRPSATLFLILYGDNTMGINWWSRNISKELQASAKSAASKKRRSAIANVNSRPPTATEFTRLLNSCLPQDMKVMDPSIVYNSTNSPSWSSIELAFNGAGYEMIWRSNDILKAMLSGKPTALANPFIFNATTRILTEDYILKIKDETGRDFSWLCPGTSNSFFSSDGLTILPANIPEGFEVCRFNPEYIDSGYVCPTIIPPSVEARRIYETTVPAIKDMTDDEIEAAIRVGKISNPAGPHDIYDECSADSFDMSYLTMAADVLEKARQDPTIDAKAFDKLLAEQIGSILTTMAASPSETPETPERIAQTIIRLKNTELHRIQPKNRLCSDEGAFIAHITKRGQDMGAISHHVNIILTNMITSLTTFACKNHVNTVVTSAAGEGKSHVVNHILKHIIPNLRFFAQFSPNAFTQTGIRRLLRFCVVAIDEFNDELIKRIGEALFKLLFYGSEGAGKLTNTDYAENDVDAVSQNPNPFCAIGLNNQLLSTLFKQYTNTTFGNTDPFSDRFLNKIITSVNADRYPTPDEARKLIETFPEKFTEAANSLSFLYSVSAFVGLLVKYGIVKGPTCLNWDDMIGRLELEYNRETGKKLEGGKRFHDRMRACAEVFCITRVVFERVSMGGDYTPNPTSAQLIEAIINVVKHLNMTEGDMARGMSMCVQTQLEASENDEIVRKIFDSMPPSMEFKIRNPNDLLALEKALSLPRDMIIDKLDRGVTESVTGGLKKIIRAEKQGGVGLRGGKEYEYTFQTEGLKAVVFDGLEFDTIIGNALRLLHEDACAADEGEDRKFYGSQRIPIMDEDEATTLSSITVNAHALFKAIKSAYTLAHQVRKSSEILDCIKRRAKIEVIICPNIASFHHTTDTFELPTDQNITITAEYFNRVSPNIRKVSATCRIMERVCQESGLTVLASTNPIHDARVVECFSKSLPIHEPKLLKFPTQDGSREVTRSEVKVAHTAEEAAIVNRLALFKETVTPKNIQDHCTAVIQAYNCVNGKAVPHSIKYSNKEVTESIICVVPHHNDKAEKGTANIAYLKNTTYDGTPPYSNIDLFKPPTKKTITTEDYYQMLSGVIARTGGNEARPVGDTRALQEVSAGLARRRATPPQPRIMDASADALFGGLSDEDEDGRASESASQMQARLDYEAKAEAEELRKQGSESVMGDEDDEEDEDDEDLSGFVVDDDAATIDMDASGSTTKRKNVKEHKSRKLQRSQEASTQQSIASTHISPQPPRKLKRKITSDDEE